MLNMHFKNERGLSLIELSILLVVLGILIYFLSPFSFVHFFNKSYDAAYFNQDSRAVFTKISQLASESPSILEANPNDLTVSTNSGIYRVFVDHYPEGTAPYKIALQKNSETAQFIADNIGLLSTPNRPGLEIVYRDRDGATTASTPDIAVIDIKLSFAKEGSTYSTQTSFYLESRDALIHAR